MSNDPHIWIRRQEIYDRWFPVIVAGCLVTFGLAVSIIVVNAKQSDTPTTEPATPSIVDTQIQQLESGTVQVAGPTTEVINLKTASASELDRLDGIGQKRAATIVQLRDEGKINSVSDLQKVSGIGEKLYSNIKDQLTWE